MRRLIMVVGDECDAGKPGPIGGHKMHVRVNGKVVAGTVGPGGVLLDDRGRPLLDADGNVIMATMAMNDDEALLVDRNRDIVRHDDRTLVLVDPDTKPGAEIVDADSGEYVLDKNGLPMVR